MDNSEQREQRLKQRKTLSDLLVILSVLLCIVLIAGGVGWHYFYGPCGVNRVEQATDTLREQYRVYDDAYQIASTTSQIALAGPVAEMQKIERDTEKIEVPACVEPAKRELIATIETSVNSFLSFMADESDAVVLAHADESRTHFMNYIDEMIAVEECAPFCK